MPLIVEGRRLHTAACAIRTTLAMVTLSAGFIGHFRGTLTPLSRLIVRSYPMAAGAS